MKKVISLLICATIILCVFCGCGSGTLPEGLTEETATERAKEIVTMLSEKDYDGVVETFDATMASALDAENLATAMDGTLTEMGAFTEFGEATVSGKTTYAVVSIPAVYENGTLNFKVSVNADETVCGLYYK